MRTLIVGYGNSLRGDDGAGPYIASKIMESRLPSVSVRVTQQVHVDLLEEANAFDQLILVDAHTLSGDVIFEPVRPDGGNPKAHSHHLNHQVFLTLARSLYGNSLQIHVCSVRGENFEFQENLTSGTRQRADCAVAMLSRFLQKDTVHA